MVGRAVANEGNAHGSVVAISGGERGTADQRSARTQNAIGAHHALGKVRHMHGAALAFAKTLRLAEDLGHHTLHINALGDAVAMAAMGRRHAVLVFQMHHDGRARSLFPGIEVNEPRDFALGKLRV